MRLSSQTTPVQMNTLIWNVFFEKNAIHNKTIYLSTPTALIATVKVCNNYYQAGQTFWLDDKQILATLILGSFLLLEWYFQTNNSAVKTLRHKIFQLTGLKAYCCSGIPSLNWGAVLQIAEVESRIQGSRPRTAFPRKNPLEVKD